MKIEIQDSWELHEDSMPKKFEYDGKTIELKTIEDLIELNEYIKTIALKGEHTYRGLILWGSNKLHVYNDYVE